MLVYSASNYDASKSGPAIRFMIDSTYALSLLQYGKKDLSI